MSSSVGLELNDVVRGGQNTLVLVGELDLASAPIFEAKMRQLCENGTSTVALDFSQLSFIDSTGVRAVLIASELCKRHGHALSLTPGTGGVQRVFEMTGLLDALPFATDGSDEGSVA
jgi:anti-sigma B factor antagonist